MNISLRVKKYINTEVCAECGGRCCKFYPGGAFPDDFAKPLIKSLMEAFKSGKWAIDRHEGDDPDEREHYIRPAVKGVNRLFDPSWGGECVFLTSSGCELSPEKRPTQCRMLEPKADPEKCISHAGAKWEAKKAWKPYVKVMLKAAEKSKKNGDILREDH